MSAASYASFQGLSKARKQLAALAAGLRDHDGVVARAAAQVAAQVEAVSRSKVNAHRDTGAAASSVDVAATGGLVLHKVNRYLDYHSWWPFRRGMPPFVVKRAAEIFAREFLSTIGAGGEAGGVATEIVAAADTASAVRAEKKAQAKVRAKIRREERAYDKRVKAQGDHE
jgi:hypothetical protein